MIKFNFKFFIIFLISLILEIIIALFIHDDFIRPFIGDVLVVILIYFLIKSFIKNDITLLPLYIFLFAAFIEICQYFNIVKLLGFENNTFISIILGSTFDFKDLLCYFVGGLILFIYQILENKKYIK